MNNMAGLCSTRRPKKLSHSPTPRFWNRANGVAAVLESVDSIRKCSSKPVWETGPTLRVQFVSVAKAADGAFEGMTNSAF